MTRCRGQIAARQAGPIRLAERLLVASDPVDLEGWEALMADDAHIRIANRAPVVGKPACLVELARLFVSVAAIGRGFRELWPSDDGQTVLMELDLWPQPAAQPLPLAIVVRSIRPEPRARDLRFYFDPSTLERNMRASQETRLI